jgi:hypothetical protein
MDDDYQRLRQDADKLFYHFKDHVDDKSSDAAQSLEKDVRAIVDDFEAQKKPRSIEDRIKRVQQTLRSLDNAASPVMDAGDIDELVDQYEDLRQDLRELDNY